MSTCASCGASVVWVLTVRGVRMPVDAVPSPDGTLRLVGVPPTAIAVGRTVDLLDTTDDGVRHVSHFATCPNADQHRRKRPTR